jgi:hypothetical protein
MLGISRQERCVFRIFRIADLPILDTWLVVRTAMDLARAFTVKVLVVLVGMVAVDNV